MITGAYSLQIGITSAAKHKVDDNIRATMLITEILANILTLGKIPTLAKKTLTHQT